MSFHPEHTYVHLAEDGHASELPGDVFWSLPKADMVTYGAGWLITEYLFTDDWPTWEMHPHGDEFVYLLSGAIELILEVDGAVRSSLMEGSGAVVVPRGVWHTAKVRAPSRMLHVTRGGETQTRPVDVA